MRLAWRVALAASVWQAQHSAMLAFVRASYQDRMRFSEQLMLLSVLDTTSQLASATRDAPIGIYREDILVWIGRFDVEGLSPETTR